MALPANDALAKKYGALSPGRFQAMLQKTDETEFLIALRNAFMVRDEIYSSMADRRLMEIACQQYGAKMTLVVDSARLPQQITRRPFISHQPDIYEFIIRQSKYHLRANVEFSQKYIQLMVLPVIRNKEEIQLINRFGLLGLHDYYMFPESDDLGRFEETFLLAACRRFSYEWLNSVQDLKILGYMDLRLHDPFAYKLLLIVEVVSDEIDGHPLTELTNSNLDLFSEYILHHLYKTPEGL